MTFSQNGLFENLQAADYEVIVQDANGCEQVFDLTVSGASPLVVGLVASASLNIGETYLLNPTLNIPTDQVATVVWSPNVGLSCTDCLQPIATPANDIIYTITVTSVDGCTASASISITVTAPEGNLYVPNAFSPNDDGLNDMLTVFADEKLVRQVVTFQVFTRWGESVFTGFGLRPNDVGMGWDGTSRGKKVDLGAYVWFAEVELATGERRLLKGDVVVVR
jgi:gliding motility-associated-like protein